MDWGLPTSSVHGIFQARILEWVTISHYRGCSRSRDQTHISCASCIGRQILHHWVHLGISWESGEADDWMCCLVGIKSWAVESNICPRPKWLQFSTPCNYRRLNGSRTPTLSGSVEKNLQETRVWSLIWEDPMCRGAAKPMCHSYWACALDPRSRNSCGPHAWSPCSATRETSAVRSLCTTARVAPTHCN